MAHSTRENVLVRHRDGVCIAAKKRTLKSQCSVRTLCGYFIIAPWGIYQRGIDQPTCPECRERERRAGETEGKA